MKGDRRYLSAGDSSDGLWLNGQELLRYFVYMSNTTFYTLLYCVKQMLNGYPVPVVVPAHNSIAQPSYFWLLSGCSVNSQKPRLFI